MTTATTTVAVGGRLAGKIALLTGATSGMGIASAIRFVSEGAFVYITGRDAGRLDKAVQLVGHNVVGIRADSSVLADIERVMAQIKQEKGHLDVLYVNPGYSDMNTPLGSITSDAINKTFDLNVTGTIFTVQCALPLSRSRRAVRSF